MSVGHWPKAQLDSRLRQDSFRLGVNGGSVMREQNSTQGAGAELVRLIPKTRGHLRPAQGGLPSGMAPKEQGHHLYTHGAHLFSRSWRGRPTDWCVGNEGTGEVCTAVENKTN